MMWKINALLPCAATALTLALLPNAQAVTIPTPYVDMDSISTPAQNPLDIGASSNAALLIRDIVVQTSANIATVYEACFEYGRYTDVFNANRPPACVNVSSLSTPQFLNQQDFAILAGGGANTPPLATEPTSNGLLTALNNALSDNVLRTQGRFYFDINDNGIIEPDNLNPPVAGVNSEIGNFVDAIEDYSINTYLIPYSVVGNSITGVLGTNSGTTWSIDTDNTSLLTDSSMFVRFRQTGTINLDGTPTTPEPSSWVGILLGGVSLLVTGRLQRP